eukprot:363865-Chlamydomonas_euryale.AAC.11
MHTCARVRADELAKSPRLGGGCFASGRAQAFVPAGSSRRQQLVLTGGCLSYAPALASLPEQAAVSASSRRACVHGRWCRHTRPFAGSRVECRQARQVQNKGALLGYLKLVARKARRGLACRLGGSPCPHGFVSLVCACRGKGRDGEEGSDCRHGTHSILTSLRFLSASTAAVGISLPAPIAESCSSALSSTDDTLRTIMGAPPLLSSANHFCCIACLKPTSPTSGSKVCVRAHTCVAAERCMGVAVRGGRQSRGIRGRQSHGTRGRQSRGTRGRQSHGNDGPARRPCMRMQL